MRATGKHQHGLTGKNPGDEFAGMSGNAACRKARQIGIGDAHGVLDLAGQPAKAGAENDGDRGSATAKPLDEQADRIHHFRISPAKP